MFIVTFEILYPFYRFSLIHKGNTVCHCPTRGSPYAIVLIEFYIEFLSNSLTVITESRVSDLIFISTLTD